jgi:hypothetical protein
LSTSRHTSHHAGQSGNPATREAQGLRRQEEDLRRETERLRLAQEHAGSAVPPPRPVDAVQAQFAARISQAGGELEEISRQNVADLKALLQRGIQFDPGQVLDARIDCLMESIAGSLGRPQGDLWKLESMIHFERRMREIILHAQREATKAQLAQGSLLSPGAIRQLASETGTYGGLG